MTQPSKILQVSGFVFLISSLFATPAVADSIEAFPSSDGYLISGGAVHHENFSKNREEAATCTNCFWKIVIICKSWDDQNHRSCPWLRLQCPKDTQVVEVFRANGNSRPKFDSSEWYFTSYSCIGESGPISTFEVTRLLQQSWFVKLPDLRIKYFPKSDAILWQPLRYQLLSDLHLKRTKNILGHQVTVNANAKLGFTCRTSPFLNNCLRSTINKIKFTQVGVIQLTAQTTWEASYDLNGIQGIPINGVQPTFQITNIFNVHPLFTHLAK